MKRTNRNTIGNWIPPRSVSWLPCLLFVVLTCTAAKAENDPSQDTAAGYVLFKQALEADKNKEAVAIGSKLLQELERTYRTNVDFGVYKSKLAAAEFLAKQMASHLKKATSKQMFILAVDLFGKSSRERKPVSLMPAKQFYDTSVLLFATPIKIETLSSEGRTFLARYYDLKLRSFASNIAKAGQALTIAEPKFRDTYNYVLVLPLLHVTPEQPVNTDVLPTWMQKADQLRALSDACLLHFAMPFQAMRLSKRAAELSKKTDFSEVDYYKVASRRCGPSQANIAAACLEKIIQATSNDEPDIIMALRLDIAQRWWDSGNYTMAAGKAKEAFKAHSDSNDYGKAVQLYYYALSRSNNTTAILADIDGAILDKRCQAYRPKLMYIKWWALRRERKQEAKIAALEHDLLKTYGNNAMVAPIILSRATVLLAQQEYLSAQSLLAELIEKFPTSKAAIQAQKMQTRLQKIQEK